MPLVRSLVPVALVALFGAPLRAEEPLRAVIDASLKAAWAREKVTPAPPADDPAFLRRVHLDLVGTAPTYAETTAFLADTDPKKREKLVEKLLADPRFATAQANTWDLVLFGRHPGGGDVTRKRDTFKAWLAKQFADNVPYDAWVRDLLLAEKPGPELFYVQYRNQPEEATIGVTRVFLGTQLGCAKCHDHPYDVWTQKDFYGMTGFFVRLVVQDAGGGKAFTIAEKSTGEVLFSGAAKDQAPGKKGDPVRPKFLGGPELDEPPVPKDFKEPAAAAKLPKPLFSRKAKLAAWVASADNPYLAKAAANRVWAQFMGRGIVHPVDDFTEKNEPSHPVLLKVMADGLVARGFDLKWLIREIVNSEAYQLAGTGPVTDALPKWFERARVRPLTAEELMATMRTVSGYDADPKAAAAPLPNAGEAYFLRFFGEPTNGLGEFQGGLSEHLFLNNAEQVRAFAKRRPGSLADKLLGGTEAADSKVERLFLSVLQRRPKEKERAAFAAHLDRGPKPETAVEDLIWVLLNSSEFRFNH